MSGNQQSSDQKQTNSKKRKRNLPPKRKSTNVLEWNEQEKLQLAEAIDMYGTVDIKKLTTCVPTKTVNQVMTKIRSLRFEYKKEVASPDLNEISFVDLNAMDDLFIVGGTRPCQVLDKWMEYLKSFYNNDHNQYNKFKLISNAFLIMSECLNLPDKPKADNDLDFRKIYYFLYRVFNQYYISKHHKEQHTTRYLHDLMLRVLQDIDYNSLSEKLSMYRLVTNWTSVNRKDSLKVYGSAVSKSNSTKNNVEKKPNFQVNILQNPLIPCFNPLRIKTYYRNTAMDCSIEIIS
ncbi:uncharacterized protein LOC126844183 [Adelges cooleyi]|uniref:uncharacterized protein LOC126844183 n=1 Tax=Adelges cooleyi TaxID=133065 RepID=UPI002180590C|nr:uncharacterized protein LOC126844183 [Adelges cooleyi]